VATRSFRICDLVIASEIAFPELPPASPSAATCRFELVRPRPLAPGQLAWEPRWTRADGGRWLSVATEGGGHRLRFADLADFVVSSGGDQVRCEPAPGVPRATLRHLFLDQVVPLLLSRRGDLVLHASAVAVDGRVLAFMGRTGRGKSVIAATLAARGLGLVTDDVLALREREGRLAAWHSYPGVRLWPADLRRLRGAVRTRRVAHYTSKLRLVPSGNGHRPNVPLELHRLYVLAPARRGRRSVAVGRVSPRVALLEVVRHTYHLDPGDRRRISETFAGAARLAESGVVRRLSFPRRHAALAAVHEAVLEDAARPIPESSATAGGRAQ
jgi:hypothetical protein